MGSWESARPPREGARLGFPPMDDLRCKGFLSHFGVFGRLQSPIRLLDVIMMITSPDGMSRSAPYQGHEVTLPLGNPRVLPIRSQTYGAIVAVNRACNPRWGSLSCSGSGLVDGVMLASAQASMPTRHAEGSRTTPKPCRLQDHPPTAVAAVNLENGLR